MSSCLNNRHHNKAADSASVKASCVRSRCVCMHSPIAPSRCTDMGTACCGGHNLIEAWLPSHPPVICVTGSVLHGCSWKRHARVLLLVACMARQGGAHPVGRPLCAHLCHTVCVLAHPGRLRPSCRCVPGPEGGMAAKVKAFIVIKF